MDLTPSLYDEMRRRARRVLRNEGCRDHETLSLVNEACVKMLKGQPPDPSNRGAFLAYSSKVLRTTLVDLAIRRRSQKRGGGVIHERSIDAEDPARNRLDARILDVHAKLEALAAVDPSLSELVEMRYFGGYSCREIGESRGADTQSIEDRWRFAKRWLRRELGDAQD